MTTPFPLQPVLENEWVVLQPLRPADYDALYAVASDPALWEQHPAKDRSTPEGFARFFGEALQCGAAFSVFDKQNGELIGTSRYKLSDASDRVVEIGWTFLARKCWGGQYNRALKALMVEYAFRYVDVVLFYIDKNNFRSRRAVEKIGAVQIEELEGKPLVLRTPDTVMYALANRKGFGHFPGY